MYMQEHPCSVCILSAFTAPLSLRINVTAWLSVPLGSTLLYHSTVQICCSRANMKDSSLQSPLHFGIKYRWGSELLRISTRLCTHPPPRPSLTPQILISFHPTPPQARAGELLLSGRALWSRLHPGLSWTHTSHSLKPLKAHAPACSHGSLKRSGGEKKKKSRVLSAVASLLSVSILPPTANTPLIASGTSGITVAHMHARWSLMALFGRMHWSF